MIYTASHSNVADGIYRTYAISGNRGKDANYEGKCYPKLAPKLSFWKIWHENIGIISEEENNRYYIQEYWEQVLSKLDPEQVYKELDDSILLCYEPNTEFCHRHIVAAWFELLLGKEVPEIMSVVDKQPTSRPAYIKKYLEEIIKNSVNMRGFKCLRALYLFKQSEKLEMKAAELEEKTGEAEEEYNQKQLKKIKN